MPGRRDADISAGQGAREIDTGGGAVVDGSVKAGGGFTGRDRIEVNSNQTHDPLSVILARLEIFDHRFEILGARMGELIGMRRDMDDIKGSVFRVLEVEPRMRQEMASLEQKASFHITLLWVVVGVLIVGVAMLWMQGG